MTATKEQDNANDMKLVSTTFSSKSSYAIQCPLGGQNYHFLIPMIDDDGKQRTSSDIERVFIELRPFIITRLTHNVSLSNDEKTTICKRFDNKPYSELIAYLWTL